jgi:hypothetical protein
MHSSFETKISVAYIDLVITDHGIKNDRCRSIQE